MSRGVGGGGNESGCVIVMAIQHQFCIGLYCRISYTMYRV